MDRNYEASDVANQVFTIYEIVKSILLNLLPLDQEDDDLHDQAQNLRDFFRLQRINTTFKDAITCSKAIQARTWRLFAADETDQQEAQQAPGSEDEWSEEDIHCHINPMIIYLDQMIHGVRTFLFVRSPRYSRLGEIYVRVAPCRWRKEFDSPRLLRSMLLFDPPSMSCPLQIQVDRIRSNIQLEKAATLGDVVDAVEDAITAAQRRDVIAIKKHKEKEKGRKRFSSEKKFRAEYAEMEHERRSEMLPLEWKCDVVRRW